MESIGLQKSETQRSQRTVASFPLRLCTLAPWREVFLLFPEFSQSFSHYSVPPSPPEYSVRGGMGDLP
jgi:hypothetical protein